MIRSFLALALAMLPVAAPAQVTTDQARAAAASAGTYLTGTPAWACDPARADGFNTTYYAAHNPDVVAAKLPLLYHWMTYGQREGRLPCEANAATLDQARAGVATLTTYVAQPMLAQVSTLALWGPDMSRTDGWSATWYTHARPDVVAAGIDLLTHWLRHGRYEGTPAYQGAPAWKPSVAADYADEPAPTLVVPDVWVLQGAPTIRIRAYLSRGIKPFERSADATARIRPDGTGVTIDDPAAGFLPDTGSMKEWTATVPPGAPATFQVAITDTGSGPSFGSVTATVHVGGMPPDGYVYSAALVVPVDPQPVIPAVATVDDDLTSLAAWHVGGFALNGMDGYFGTPTSFTLSGRKVDPVPLVTEAGVTFRRFLPQDFRRDPMTIPGGFSGWSMSAITRDLGGATGMWMIRERLNRYPGLDMATMWGIAQPGSWPPELDSNETWSHSDTPDRQYLTWHLLPDGHSTGMSAYRVPEGVWIDRLVQRSPRTAEPDGIARYRQWVRLADNTGPWRLTYECPDFLEGIAIGTNINTEGWGGAGGGSAPAQGATPFDAVAAKAYFDIARVRYWKPGS